MIDLVRHLVLPLVSNPEAIKLQAVEGEAAIIIEMSVDAADREALEEDVYRRAIRSIRNVLSAAAGKRKATLELVDEDGFTALSEADTEE